jgi:hypothetical protein
MHVYNRSTTKVFFLGNKYLPEVTGKYGYREISEISVFFRSRLFKRNLNSKIFERKTNNFNCISIVLPSERSGRSLC